MNSLDQSIIVEIAAGETLNIEFKSDDKSGGLSDTKVFEAAAALSNAQGGKIYIGVRDNWRNSCFRKAENQLLEK